MNLAELYWAVYFLYTVLMTSTASIGATTVKVSKMTHERLKAGAGAYRSMNDYLEYLLRLDERRQMIDAMRQAIANTPTDQMASWRAESAAWEATSLADAT